MKTRFASRLLCMLLCIVLLTAVASIAFADTYGTYYYTTAPVNIRSGPGTQYSIIGSLTTGQIVIGTGISGNWIQIYTSNNVAAYVSASYLSLYQYADASARVYYPSCYTPTYYNYYNTQPNQVFAYYPGYPYYGGYWYNRGWSGCGSYCGGGCWHDCGR